MSLTEAYDLGLPRNQIKNVMQLVRLLQEKYPSHNWNKMFIMKGRLGQQRRLENSVASLFPVSLPPFPSPPPGATPPNCVRLGFNDDHQCKKRGGNHQSFHRILSRTGYISPTTQPCLRIPSITFSLSLALSPPHFRLVLLILNAICRINITM